MAWKSGTKSRVECKTGKFAEIAHVKKIVLSGVSSSKSKISDSNFVEAYIKESFLKDFKKKYLSVDSDKPNVILHLVQELVKDPLPIGYLIADFSEHLGPREKERVKELVREL